MAAWSWGRLVELQVDFGREVYVAWQMAEGKRLYENLAYYYGPLSPEFNALLFRLFGVSLRTLMVGNLVIASLITVVLYLLFRRLASAFAASVACLLFVLVFACASYVLPNSFNYVCPYSHTATHGLLLGLGSILLAGRVNRAPTRLNAFVCGLAIGLTFLTKPELFVAAFVAVLVGLCLTCAQHRLTRGAAFGLAVAWLAGTVLVGLSAFAALGLEMPPRTALMGVLGSWPYIRNQADTQFYQRMMGTDDIRTNVMGIVRVLPWYGAMFIPLALYVQSRKRGIIVLALGGVSLAAAAVCSWSTMPNPFDVLRPLPIFLGVLAIALTRRLVRSKDVALAQSLTPKLMLTVFAGLLLGRILLKTSAIHYGFVLSVPGALILIVAWLCWLPDWVGAPANRLVHTGTVLGVAILWAFVSLVLCRAAYQGKLFPVGSGYDRFLGDQRGQYAAPLLEDLRHRVRPGDTLSVLPEGILINYLARIDSSVPFDSFIPPVLQIFGESRILASFRARPPDYVLLSHRETPEYGAALFGRDYGRELFSWVMEHYSPVAQYGRDPMSEGGDGFILMARRTGPVSETREPANRESE
jgi:hypothetical protein